MTLLISGRANSRRQMLCTPTTFSQPSPHRAASGRGLLWAARIDCSTPRNAGFSTGSSSGCSSSSASSHSGSSSSSPGSPSPSRRRHDSRRRSRSKSKPPKRDEKERKRRSPSPKPTKVHAGRLTRNVTEDHMEIFSTYGKIKMIDVPVERMHPHLSTGYAYVECENPDGAEKVLKHADGGHIDGQQITAATVLAPWPRPPPRRFSPPRRMLPPPPMWRRSPPRMRRRSRPPRLRSPSRRSPRSCSSFNSSRCAGPPKLCPTKEDRLERNPLPGQASKVKAVIATFPLAAEFRLQERYWFGGVLIKMPSSLLAKAYAFLVPDRQFSGRAAGRSRGLREEQGAPGGGTAPAWEHVFPFHR
ncbi:RNA-binding protein with serine-rich domain 1-like [Neophocaena asiaeorientalis asiaeorientalis]|uniref:RNA-binding protein with serine-rich domain 1 n=1 Tax=Neophocaena asiaeorientalis asiaeorientalis TaxID=1706337 RepID=A0A341B7T3_NEOAA|nr:RNA-binding protein with serine-rich domain 1-like [Neophocaena asiaeorientalis asiaeorientalis]